MPKLTLKDPRLPYIKLEDTTEYWQLEPPFETTHLLIARLRANSKTALNHNTGSIIVVVEGTVSLEVKRPLVADATEQLSPGEGYLFSDETEAWVNSLNPSNLVVFRAGGPGGHPNTNRPN